MGDPGLYSGLSDLGTWSYYLKMYLYSQGPNVFY